ncbi:hypothetical protein F4781DRAFT_324442 [Annulohypoxylon bovei var. microspora]|nr:hypothetical protein F4781DRAFT_324442 [Annulohypoxylon bovei var. microspora]
MKFLNLLLLGLAAESHQAVINPGQSQRRDVQNWNWNRDQAHCIVCVEYQKTQFNNGGNGSFTIIEQAVIICQDQGPCQSLDYLNMFHNGWAPPDAVQAARNVWG